MCQLHFSTDSLSILRSCQSWTQLITQQRSKKTQRSRNNIVRVAPTDRHSETLLCQLRWKSSLAWSYSILQGTSISFRDNLQHGHCSCITDSVHQYIYAPPPCCSHVGQSKTLCVFLSCMDRALGLHSTGVCSVSDTAGWQPNPANNLYPCHYPHRV